MMINGLHDYLSRGLDIIYRHNGDGMITKKSRRYNNGTEYI